MDSSTERLNFKAFYNVKMVYDLNPSQIAIQMQKSSTKLLETSGNYLSNALHACQTSYIKISCDMKPIAIYNVTYLIYNGGKNQNNRHLLLKINVIVN